MSSSTTSSHLVSNGLATTKHDDIGGGGGEHAGLLPPHEGEETIADPVTHQSQRVSRAVLVLVTAIILLSLVLVLSVASSLASLVAGKTEEAAVGVDFPAVPLARPPLRFADRQALLLLTGRGDEEELPLTAATALRDALDEVATAQLRLRPALQSALWRQSCRSFLPCPYPANFASNTTGAANSTDTWTDEEWERTITTRPTVAGWRTSLSSVPLVDASAIFPEDLNAAGGRFAPGETASSQRLAQQFQVFVHEQQHPDNCSAARYFIYDQRQEHSGFGMFQHIRAVHLFYAVRLGRVLFEPADVISYPLAYSDCTRRHGFGGCDVFLRNSHCTPPDGWQAEMQAEKEAYGAVHGQFVGDWTSWGDRHGYLQHRRYLTFDESAIGERYELVHSNKPPYRHEDFAWDAKGGSYDGRFALMPDCWWYGQLVSYNMRMTVTAQTRLLEELARTLQLPEPNRTAQRVVNWASGHASSVNRTDFWWLSIQALKVEWQLHRIAPDLVAALQTASSHTALNLSSSTTTAADERRVPLLGYTFVRHGDKGSEAPLHGEDEYLQLMQHVQQHTGLSSWYVGADDLLSADVIRSLDNSSTLTLLSNSLVDSIPDKASHKLSRGFSMNTARTLSDADREAILWRTLVDTAMAQLADVHVSTWTSNHPRLVYKLAQALSDARQALPFVGVDAGYDRDEDTNLHLQAKRRHFPQCSGVK